MRKTANLYVRIEPEVKEQAENIFAMLGIQASAAISMFYKQVILHGGLPFDVKIPEDLPKGMRRLTDEEAKEIIVAGYRNIKDGETKSAKDVFDKLHKDFKI